MLFPGGVPRGTPLLCNHYCFAGVSKGIYWRQSATEGGAKRMGLGRGFGIMVAALVVLLLIVLVLPAVL
jgi:hypothetical protein